MPWSNLHRAPLDPIREEKCDELRPTFVILPTFFYLLIRIKTSLHILRQALHYKLLIDHVTQNPSPQTPASIIKTYFFKKKRTHANIVRANKSRKHWLISIYVGTRGPARVLKQAGPNPAARWPGAGELVFGDVPRRASGLPGGRLLRGRAQNCGRTKNHGNPKVLSGGWCLRPGFGDVQQKPGCRRAR